MILYYMLYYLILLNCSSCLKLSFFETYQIIHSGNWIPRFIYHFVSFHSHCYTFAPHCLFHTFIAFTSIHLFYISIIASVFDDQFKYDTPFRNILLMYIYLMPSKDGSLILIKTLQPFSQDVF